MYYINWFYDVGKFVSYDKNDFPLKFQGPPSFLMVTNAKSIY